MTAAYVAHSLNFAPSSNKKSLFVGSVLPAGDGTIKWTDFDDNVIETTKGPEQVKDLSQKYLLCITGEYLDKIFDLELVGKFIRNI